MKWGTALSTDNKPSTIADYKQKRPGFGLNRTFLVEGRQDYGNLLWKIWQLSGEWQPSLGTDSIGKSLQVINLIGSPSGVRTRVTGVRGRRPKPLDDGTNSQFLLGFNTANLDLMSNDNLLILETASCLLSVTHRFSVTNLECNRLNLQTRLFPFSKSKNQIDYKSDKRHGGDNPPQGLFARRAEILLGHIHNGPYGA